MRVPFLLAMLLMLCAMLCAGRIAKKEFGWRIFKMCGTKIEMLRVYEIIYSLSAVLKLDCALTMLVLVFGVIYLLPRYEETGEFVLLILATALSLSWLLGAIVSKRLGWRHFWWRWAGLALLQPGFLVFKIPEIFAYELCRKAHINCTDLQLDTDLERYEQVWELPIYVAAACSITARMVTFAMLRRAAAQDLIWEKDGAGGLGSTGGFGSKGAQWRLPKDLASDLWTSRAQLSRMVSGAALRVLSRSLSASTSEAAASEAGAAAADAEPDARLSGWRAWLAQGKEISRLVARWLDGSLRLRDGSLRERTSRSQHLHRFVQMSADLTTLRWSWSDYILLHEIVAIEADEPGLALRLHHGPRDALKVLELTFEEEGTWSTWHEGMKALHAVLLEGAGEPRKLEWLLQIFRLADTANLGSVSEVQLRELMLYLNYEEREEKVAGAPPPRQSISSRFGALLAPVRRAQSTHNFREFQQDVQAR